MLDTRLGLNATQKFERCIERLGGLALSQGVGGFAVAIGLVLIQKDGNEFEGAAADDGFVVRGETAELDSAETPRAAEVAEVDRESFSGERAFCRHLFVLFLGYEQCPKKSMLCPLSGAQRYSLEREQLVYRQYCSGLAA